MDESVVNPIVKEYPKDPKNTENSEDHKDSFTAPFRRYPEDSTDWRISKNAEWIVQDDISGFQLSYWTDGNTVRIADQYNFIGSEHKLAPWIQRYLRPEYETSVKEIYKKICENHHSDRPNVAIVYGSYNCKSDCDFCVYAVGFWQDSRTHVLLHVDEANQLCTSVGMHYAPILYRGFIETCFSYCRKRTVDEPFHSFYFILSPVYPKFDSKSKPVVLLYKS